MPEKTFHMMCKDGKALLSVEDCYDSGNIYVCHLFIKDGLLVITPAETPFNPSIPLDKVKELIAEYEAQNA